MVILDIQAHVSEDRYKNTNYLLSKNGNGKTPDDQEKGKFQA